MSVLSNNLVNIGLMALVHKSLAVSNKLKRSTGSVLFCYIILSNIYIAIYNPWLAIKIKLPKAYDFIIFFLI